jgi:pyrroline-5-carboxylate reductase
MIDSAIRHGVPRSIANEVVIQTLIGAAEMMSQTQVHPNELQDMVFIYNS